MAELVLHEIGPSPNSMKARIALRYKGLPFERKAVDPNNREEMVKLSGQPLTPVLTHGERVIFDSAAILRYLDGNFRSTPSLYASDYAEMQAIEDFETYGRTQLMQPVGMVFGQCFAETKDPSKLTEASRLLNENTARLEERLAKGRWLVGDRMTAADVTCAPVVFYGMLSGQAAEANPIAGFFAKSLNLGDGRDKTREWVGRVMAYDKG